MFSNDPLCSEFAVRGRYVVEECTLPQILATRAAIALYNRACSRSSLTRIWSRLRRRRCQLGSLADIVRECQIQERHRLGLHSVPVRSICGSEERSEDFDDAFRPRNPFYRARWLNIAVARQLGIALPPVDLIQVGQVYYVRDGHHRISVARAMGQEEIEAEVTIWKIECPESRDQQAGLDSGHRPDRLSLRRLLVIWVRGVA